MIILKSASPPVDKKQCITRRVLQVACFKDKATLTPSPRLLLTSILRSGKVSEIGSGGFGRSQAEPGVLIVSSDDKTELEAASCAVGGGACDGPGRVCSSLSFLPSNLTLLALDVVSWGEWARLDGEPSCGGKDISYTSPTVSTATILPETLTSVPEGIGQGN